MIDARSLVPGHDVLLVTLDTLRYDVAVDALRRGPHARTWRALLPGGAGSSGTRRAASPTPPHQRLLRRLPADAGRGRGSTRACSPARSRAARRPAAERRLRRADIVTGLAGAGYHTVCIGGVGFFNKRSPLGSVLPGLFAESHWAPSSA